MTNEDMVKAINRESHKVTTFLGFLIDMPDLATTLTGIDKDKIQFNNLLKLGIAEIWIKEMKKRLEKISDKKHIEAMKELPKLMEIN